MWDVISKDFHIFRLDPATKTWKDDRVLADGRADTHADVLWNGSKLFIASHQFPKDTQPAVAGDPSLLFRYSYDKASQKYALDPGYPATINTAKSETLTIDQDSTGTALGDVAAGQHDLRQLHDQRHRPHPVGDSPPAAAGAGVSVDDTSAIVSYGGNRMGVMWSSQHGKAPDGMYFSSHLDGTPDTAWSAPAAATQGPRSSDDHINLKADKSPGGHVYAAVKNSNVNLKLPLLELLVMDTSDRAVDPPHHRQGVRVPQPRDPADGREAPDAADVRDLPEAGRQHGRWGLHLLGRGDLREVDVDGQDRLPAGARHAADHRPGQLRAQRLVHQAEHRGLDGAGRPRRQLREQQVLVLLRAPRRLTLARGDWRRRRRG